MQDMQAKMAQIQVELKRIEANQETEGAKLAIQQMDKEAQRKHQHESEGFRAGLDMTKHREQMSHQARQSDRQMRNQQAQKPPAKKGD
jgi:hypothetical protein